MTPEINFNDAPIAFTGSTWLGLDNPFRLNGITTAWQGAQVYVEVYDRDANTDGSISYQLVDQWRLSVEHLNFTAGATFGPPLNYPGIHGYSNLNVIFRVECAENYYGVLCENLNECLSESIDCNQGNCVDGEELGTCVCNPGYTGQFCETEINECDVLNIDCNENEQCMDELNSYSCVCNTGYTGADCETNIDDCESRNCSGNGVCVDGVNSFSCGCMSGFTGEMCSVEIQAAIAGEVVGGLVGIVLIAVLVIVIVIIVKNKQESSISGGTAEIDIPCNNNVVYGVCEMAQPQPVYESVEENNEKLMINVNVSYATVVEHA